MTLHKMLYKPKATLTLKVFSLIVDRTYFHITTQR